jgi:hypothetical protein
VVQEAWCRGIPVIYSRANSGIIDCNPFLSEESKGRLADLELRSPNDPYELWNRISDAHTSLTGYSEEVHQIYEELTMRAEGYVTNLFEVVIEGFKNKGVYNAAFFKMPFARPDCEELWTPRTKTSSRIVLSDAQTSPTKPLDVGSWPSVLASKF